MNTGTGILGVFFIALTVMCISQVSCAASQIMYLQVNDVHDQPVQHVCINVAGRGVSLETSQNGTTHIALPPTIEPGDLILLQLDKLSTRTWKFVQPWNGMATVPKANSVALVILSKLGDKYMLRTDKGMTAVLSQMESKVIDAKKVRPKIDELQLQAIEASVTKSFGFTPKQVADAARTRVKLSTDGNEKALINRYQRRFCDTLEKLNELPGYSSKARLLEQMRKLNGLITFAIGDLPKKIHGFEYCFVSYSVSEDGLSLSDSQGVRSIVDTQLSVIPTYTISADGPGIVVTIEFEGKVTELFRQTDLYTEVDSNVVRKAVENYFEPRLGAVTEKYVQSHAKESERLKP